MGGCPVGSRHDFDMAWESEAARSRTRAVVARLGFPQPPDWYPFIERRRLRRVSEVEDRALVLNVVINCSYGMPIDLAREWLGDHGLSSSLTAAEHEYLVAVDHGAAADSFGHRLQVEALWTLAWGLSLAPALNWNSYCGDELASWFPNLRTSEDTPRFRSSTLLRTDAEVLDELDVAFCLTWGCAEANLRQQPVPGDVRDYVIWERRRALEWLMADDWDNPNYDT
jgi:uncharacterized protein DUF4272